MYEHEWPASATRTTIELVCYRENLKPEHGGLGAYEHIKNAVQLNHGEDSFYWHRWTELIFRRLCEQEWVTIWGPGSSGKSAIVGMWHLWDWMAAPHETTSNLASTTKIMLRKRIWGAIQRWYQTNDYPGELIPSQDMIVFRNEGETIKDTKNGIFGVGILRDDGSAQLGNLIGMHNMRNRFVLDEMQATEDAGTSAVDNLSIGGSDFKFTGMGNPFDDGDPLVRMSEPSDPAGWASVNVESEEWKTHRGVCIHLDGLKSPALDPGGARKYPLMIGAQHIERLKNWYGENHPSYWTFIRGFKPQTGVQSTVFSRVDFTRYETDRKPTFASEPFWLAACDPAFSAGGDVCFLSLARCGMTVEGLMVLQWMQDIPIKVTGHVEKVNFTEAQATEIVRICRQRGITANNYAEDVTGAQRSHADMVEQLFGNGRIHRVDFAGLPSQLPVSSQDPTPANLVYDRRVTELWFMAKEYVSYRQLVGFSEEAKRQFSSRRWRFSKGRTAIEDKKDFRRHFGCSPDNADSKVVLLDMLRVRFGILPGGSERERRKPRDAAQELTSVHNFYRRGHPVVESFSGTRDEVL